MQTKHRNTLIIALSAGLIAVGLTVCFVVFLLSGLESSPAHQPPKPQPVETATELDGGRMIQQGVGVDCSGVFASTQTRLQTQEQQRKAELEIIEQAAGLGQKQVSAETVEFLKRAVDACSLSGGSYDITTGALRRLWGFGGAVGAPPSDTALQSALATAGVSQISFNEEKSAVGLGKIGAKFDCGGFRQGYETDLALQAGRDGGLSYMLVRYGYTMASFGGQENVRNAYAVPNPDNPAASLGSLEFSDCAVSSCGIYTEGTSVGGQPVHSVLDPASGKPAAAGIKAVTVCAPTAAEAAVQARSLMVKGADYLRAHRNELRAVAVLDDNSLLISDSLASKFTTNTQNNGK